MKSRNGKERSAPESIVSCPDLPAERFPRSGKPARESLRTTTNQIIHTSRPPSEVISIMSDKVEFSPAIPWPAPFDVQKRIQELRGYLDPKNPRYEFEQQHVNIKAVIQPYEDGIIDGSEDVFVMEGKVVTNKRRWKELLGLGLRYTLLSPFLEFI
jgi:hypothetical protein